MRVVGATGVRMHRRDRTEKPACADTVLRLHHRHYCDSGERKARKWRITRVDTPFDEATAHFSFYRVQSVIVNVMDESVRTQRWDISHNAISDLIARFRLARRDTSR